MAIAEAPNINCLKIGFLGPFILNLPPRADVRFAPLSPIVNVHLSGNVHFVKQTNGTRRANTDLRKTALGARPTHTHGAT